MALAACASVCAATGARAAPDQRCYMITYTAGSVSAAFQVRKYGEGAEKPFTFQEILELIRRNARELGMGDVAPSPTGIFPVGCEKGG